MGADDCSITNCHGTIIHLNVGKNNSLNLFMYQRSVDVICGLPHNLIQYWAFLHWLAFKTDKKVGVFDWTGGDVHIYEQHTELAKKLLLSDFDSIKPCHMLYYPNDKVNPNSPDDFKANDFMLTGLYNPLLIDKAIMVV
jgi:thymidylate synthase